MRKNGGYIIMKKNKVLFSALCISAALVVIAAGFCGCKSAAMPNKDVGAAQGGAGEKPVVATRISADENEEVYEVRFTDGKAFTFSVPRGKTGNDGAKGDVGEKGDAGESAYEQYVRLYDYKGDEKQWLEDLASGKLNDKKQYYTVAFESDYGNQIASQKVLAGQKAYAPKLPERENYTFEGWYSGEEKWSFCGFPVTENVVLTAKWSENYTKGLLFERVENGWAIAGAGSASEQKLVIPSEIDGLPVVEIKSGAFRNCSFFSYLCLPAGLKTVETGAFAGCSSLKEIAFPAGLTAVCDGAFENCSSLISVNLPTGTESVGDKAFSGCVSLEDIALPGVKSIGKNAFFGCVSLRNLVLSERLQNISDGAFFGCVKLEKATLPSEITKIGTKAFSGCSALSEIIFSGSMQQWEKVEKADGWTDANIIVKTNEEQNE